MEKQELFKKVMAVLLASEAMHNQGYLDEVERLHPERLHKAMLERLEMEIDDCKSSVEKNRLMELRSEFSATFNLGEVEYTIEP